MKSLPRKVQFGAVLEVPTKAIVIARTSADGRLSNQFNWYSKIKRIQGSATFYLLDKHGIFLPSRNDTKNSNYRRCVGRRSVLLTLRPNKLILPLPSLGAYKDIIRLSDRSRSPPLMNDQIESAMPDKHCKFNLGERGGAACACD